MRLLKYIRNDKDQRMLFICVFIAFIALIFVVADLPLWSCLNPDGFVGVVMKSTVLKEISKGLLSGVIASYIFYLWVNVYPDLIKKGNNIQIMDDMILGCMGLYTKGKPINVLYNIRETEFKFSDLQKMIEDLGNCAEHERQYDFFRKVYATSETIKRYDAAFDALAQIAINTSEEIAIIWLELIRRKHDLIVDFDKVASCDFTLPNRQSEDCLDFKPWAESDSIKNNPYAERFGSLCFSLNNFLEIVEQYEGARNKYFH
ncbi:hypothetical protein LH452_15310 [Laribacter hongkongensis]|uniref:hypothetical protein n=1 Tax=Laribacter hongkongensis TaxID=168471 RepID=UPI001EFED5A4|nr:hypothetical protein [Laribacter hongkongensis]MCG9060248.1 hypothetical protein [Laribacter hongkongensis]MCG9087381.1 hypothetical protein [Laribacter hongkongensis]